MKVGVRLTSSNDAPLPNMSISPEISAPGSGCCKGLIVFEAAIVGVSSFDLTGGRLSFIVVTNSAPDPRARD